MNTDIIAVTDSSTLPGLFRERVSRTPDAEAYRQFCESSQAWISYSWKQAAEDVARWQAAISKYNLEGGDRVAIMINNSYEWMLFEQAALGLGLVIVPLYINDSADNVAYILNNAGARLLFIAGDEQWEEISKEADQFETIEAIITLKPTSGTTDPRLITVKDWLPEGQFDLQEKDGEPFALTTIVYTSGTTGKPKGVMLSHQNILSNAHAALECIDVTPDDLFLSFLPLSHMFERTVGYYLPMMAGATIAFSRGIPVLGEDLMTIKPTCLISVPRIYEKVYAKIMDGLEEKSPIAKALFNKAVDVGWYRFEYQQGRASWHPKLLLWPILKKLVAGKVLEKLGGRLKLAATGGAAISPKVSQLFIGLGVPLIQGYGLTETSPILSLCRVDDNDPTSVGKPLPGVEIRKTEEGELIAKGPCVMLGYWRNKEATDEVIDEDGWFHTGDKMEFRDGRVYIVGRIKDIIVLSNGEKMPPGDMEMAAALDPCFEQVMVIGESRPYPTALIVLGPDQWAKQAKAEGLESLPLEDEKVEKFLTDHLAELLKDFPGYAKVRRAACTLEAWTVENGMITPTLKTKRKVILEKFEKTIDRLYEGH